MQAELQGLLSSLFSLLIVAALAAIVLPNLGNIIDALKGDWK